MKGFKTAALYVCTILGAGFATGKELMEYFVRYGKWGFLGITISSFIFAIAAYIIISSQKPFKEGKLLSFVTTSFLIVLYSAMLSAGGELLENIYNIPYVFGSSIMAFVTLITIKWKYLADISLILCPIMVAIAIATSLYLVLNNQGEVNKSSFSIGFIPSAIIYASYNIITALTVLLSQGKKSYALSTALVSGVIIVLTATALAFPLYLNYSSLSNESLPLIALLPENTFITYLYIFMLMCAIFTTAASNCFSATVKTGLSTIIVTLISLLLSFIGFENIVSHIYFIFGLAGTITLIKIFKHIG